MEAKEQVMTFQVDSCRCRQERLQGKENNSKQRQPWRQFIGVDDAQCSQDGADVTG